MEKIKLEVISPQKLIISCDCKYVSLPGTEGILEVRYGHEPIIVQLKNGQIKFGESDEIDIQKGFAIVHSNLCRVLTI